MSKIDHSEKPINRREFLKTSGTVVAGSIMLPGIASAYIGSDPGWKAGDLNHIVPTASHNRFLIKTSFKYPRTKPPILRVNLRSIVGVQTDSEQMFWQFDVTGLHPNTNYQLQLREHTGKKITDVWPLKTFPGPQDRPEKVRILCYTCAGGYDGPAVGSKTTWLDMAARKQLLAKAMSFSPDVVIANGDHVYWDLKTFLNKPKKIVEILRNEYWKPFGGEIDIDLPMTAARNYPIFRKVVDYQIAGLYGTTLRSTPSFFITDDHDEFENDEFNAKLATLPPDSYGTFGADLTQLMYYPEFLPVATQPDYMEGTGRLNRAKDTNMLFGTLRYGELLEANLFNCRRYVDYKRQHAKVIPQWVEKWLIDRIRAEDTNHHMLMPSLPFGYTSGKLGDWYPDVLDRSQGKLVIYAPKDGYQWGWFGQHQRLIQAMAGQKKRTPVIIEGDLHATSAGKILASGELKLDNPVHTVLAGSLGTGDLGFPSAVRGIAPAHSELIQMEETLKPTEKNGFSIIDVLPEKILIQMYLWRPPQPITEIETITPALVYEIDRA